MILSQILLATFAAGLLSVLAAALISLPLLKGSVHQLVSLSAGLLLATAVLHVLPEAIESGANLHLLCATLLAGLIGFFLRHLACGDRGVDLVAAAHREPRPQSAPSRPYVPVDGPTAFLSSHRRTWFS